MSQLLYDIVQMQQVAAMPKKIETIQEDIKYEYIAIETSQT